MKETKDSQTIKENLKSDYHKDLKKIQGALAEVIEHNRKINHSLVEQMLDEDFTLLEEYSALTKGIIDASKLLSDIHSQAPKIITDQSKIQDEKKKIDLDSLISGDAEDVEDSNA